MLWAGGWRRKVPRSLPVQTSSWFCGWLASSIPQMSRLTEMYVTLCSWAATNNSCFYHSGVYSSSTLTIFEAPDSYSLSLSLSQIHVSVHCWYVSTSHSFCFPIRWSLLGKQEQCKTHQGRAVNPQLTGCCDSGGQFIFVVHLMLGEGELSHGWQCLFLTTVSVSWPVLPPPATRWVVMECYWGGHPRGWPWLCMGSWFQQKSPVLQYLLHFWAAPGKDSPAAYGLPLQWQFAVDSCLFC